MSTTLQTPPGDLADLVDRYAVLQELPPLDWLYHLKLERPRTSTRCLGERTRFVKRLMDITASHFAVPWQDASTKAAGTALFNGGEYWPYGIEGSRTTLEAFYRWCYEQGVTARHLKPEEVYAPETLSEFKI